MDEKTTNVIFNLFLAIISGILLFFILDILFFHNFEIYQNLFFIFLIISILLIAFSYKFYIKSKYLNLTIKKLIGVEKDIGISSYINNYLNSVVESDIFNIEKEYNNINEHLEENYIFPVREGDFINAIEAIFKSGDIYYVSLIKSSNKIINVLKNNLSKTKVKLIIPREIIDSIDKDFLKKIRRYAKHDLTFWRMGTPSTVFNVILSLKMSNNEGDKYSPIRAIKFEIGNKDQKDVGHIVTDKASLKYWNYYFKQDWGNIEDKIKSPIINKSGASSIKNTIIEICDNYPDLFTWMKEEIEKNKANAVINRAIIKLKKSNRYQENKCLEKICNLCER